MNGYIFETIQIKVLQKLIVALHDKLYNGIIKR